MKTIREIDRGGFGVVHEVELSDGNRVARKSFDPQIRGVDEKEKLRRRFEREVRIQSQISHPNIMTVLDSDMNASPPWFTMPLASQSFEAKLSNDHDGGLFDTRPWQDILAAVEELHRLGYVHRDLKPANILLVGDNWVLSDFGLILPTSRDTTVLTGTKSAYGSMSYAAPEQAQDFRNTPDQADVYALGCILHDALEKRAMRIPFAQIRLAGVYGPLLEKCTDVDFRKRFPSVAALRAALFEIWRLSSFTPPTTDDASLLDSVLAEPENSDAWRNLLGNIEASDDRSAALRGLNADLLVRLHAVDEVLFTRAMHLICDWAKGSAFEWDYCDVVGDRMLEAYRVGNVRVRCEIVLATLELAVFHNRWHVMNHVGVMLTAAADNGLIDRILIEMNLDPGVAYKLMRIERGINWRRARWHEKLAARLNEIDEADNP